MSKWKKKRRRGWFTTRGDGSGLSVGGGEKRASGLVWRARVRCRLTVKQLRFDESGTCSSGVGAIALHFI
jgi:hypothetical protein